MWTDDDDDDDGGGGVGRGDDDEEVVIVPCPTTDVVTGTILLLPAAAVVVPPARFFFVVFFVGELLIAVGIFPPSLVPTVNVVAATVVRVSAATVDVVVLLVITLTAFDVARDEDEGEEGMGDLMEVGVVIAAGVIGLVTGLVIDAAVVLVVREGEGIEDLTGGEVGVTVDDVIAVVTAAAAVVSTGNKRLSFRLQGTITVPSWNNCKATAAAVFSAV